MGEPARNRARPNASRRTPGASPPPPSERPPTVLLSVAGLTPQVITETLYCLLVQRDPPPDIREVHVFTTGAGERRIREKLLAPRDGLFARFCRDVRIPRGRIRFDPGTLHVLKDGRGRPVEDVRTPEDNVRLADELLALVRELTSRPEIAVHASVAGGRKTMGLLLGIAFQLFARPQDRLSHVLVSPPDLENCPDFYYPPPRAVTLSLKGKRLSTARARVELVEIPMLRLREKLQGLDLERGSYRELVGQIQAELDRLVAPPPLHLDTSAHSLRIADQIVRLTPLEFAVYRLAADRRRAGCGAADCQGCAACTLRAQDFRDGTALTELRQVVSGLKVRDQRALDLLGWKKEGDVRFLQVNSKVERKLRQALGPGQWVERYLVVHSNFTGLKSMYYLPLDPAQIVVE